MSEDHPFKPGTEVWLVRYNRYSFGISSAEKSAVNKLHKTGRFTVEGRDCQFKASRQYGGEGWQAFSVGGRYSYETVEIMTPQLAEAIAAGERSRRLDSAVERLRKQKAVDFSEADVAALEDIVARYAR